RIIWLIADQSGCVQQTVDFHCRRTLSAGTASASSRNPLCGVFRLVLFPLESPPSIAINWPSKWNMRGSWGRRGLDETPECVSTRRLISRPWKASIFHLRLSNAIPAYYGGMYLNRVALVTANVFGRASIYAQLQNQNLQKGLFKKQKSSLQPNNVQKRYIYC